jgi:hypothetical protein
MKFKASVVWAVRAALSGIISFSAPKALIASGVPLDRWATDLGAYVGVHYSAEAALWGVTAISFATLLFVTRNWGATHPIVSDPNCEMGSDSPSIGALQGKDRPPPLIASLSESANATDSLDGVRIPYSRRNASLRDALVYAAFRDWRARELGELNGKHQEIADANDHFQQLAYDAILRSWGKPANAGANALYEPIPFAHWREYETVYPDVVYGEVHTVRRGSPLTTHPDLGSYLDVRVSSDEFEKEWPLA